MFAENPVKRLAGVRKKEKRVALGLMSGTSADGLDVAMVEFSGKGLATRAKLLSFTTYPFGASLKKRVLRLGASGAEEICEMNFLLGEFFAQCVLDFLRRLRHPPGAVDFIGSHGQTIYHLSGDCRRRNSTLQIGEGALIAARTGILTVCDFRPADIASGGTGAPLVPYADFVLFRKKGRVRAMLNIGGIANVTVVPWRMEDVWAFDTGPGNMVMDGLVGMKTRGRRKWDRNGEIAAQGKVDRGLLDEWLRHPYFSRKPPKSTGRETFGEEFVAHIWSGNRRRPFTDLLATATYLTAASVHKGFRDFVFPRISVDEMYVSGGGAHNRTLMSFLGELFRPVPVLSLDLLGIDGDAKEALAFALLADATLQGMPSNVPRATGAGRPALLGKIILC